MWLFHLVDVDALAAGYVYRAPREGVSSVVCECNYWTTSGSGQTCIDAPLAADTLLLAVLMQMRLLVAQPRVCHGVEIAGLATIIRHDVDVVVSTGRNWGHGCTTLLYMESHIKKSFNPVHCVQYCLVIWRHSY